MDIPWLYGKVYRNRSRSSGRKRWAGQRIWWFGAGRGRKTKSSAQACQVDGKEIFPNRSKQAKAEERRRIGKEAKGSQCAGKCGCDRATSKAQ